MAMQGLGAVIKPLVLTMFYTRCKLFQSHTLDLSIYPKHLGVGSLFVGYVQRELDMKQCAFLINLVMWMVLQG